MAMARRARDRVTIDLCGIADAVRAAAQARDATLAVFARQALIAALPADAAKLLPCTEEHGDASGTVKLSVRLPHDASAILATQAALLGLSQARLVALLIRGAELPQPVRERASDRAALCASTEQLAALSVDLQQFMRLLHRADSVGAERYRQRIMSVDSILRAHIDLASAFLANNR
jgi:hypothetical protein